MARSGGLGATLLWISHICVFWDGCPLTSSGCGGGVRAAPLRPALRITADSGILRRILLKCHWVFEIAQFSQFSVYGSGNMYSLIRNSFCYFLIPPLEGWSFVPKQPWSTYRASDALEIGKTPVWQAREDSILQLIRSASGKSTNLFFCSWLSVCEITLFF